MSSPRTYPMTIVSAVEHEIVIKKSRFITHAVPVSFGEERTSAASVAEADRIIAAIRKRAWDAAHNCTAMITGLDGEQARSSDDGEPSGTAGVPMLEVLRQRGLTDVVVIVTRYFGGTKLGAGGLVRAYSSAVSEALDRAALVKREVLTQVRIDVSHAEVGRFDNLLREWAGRHGATLGEPHYGAVASLELWVPPNELGVLEADLAAASAGGVLPLLGDDRIIDVPVHVTS
ncbi:MAG: IMPACT family protein [Microbacterium sp.]|uniref:IMPACT family protein n=1 Tax=Microbacterium sp. TaxID=51671 RepID=UPI003F952E61